MSHPTNTLEDTRPRRGAETLGLRSAKVTYVLLFIFIVMATASAHGQKPDSPKAGKAPALSLSKPKTRAITITNDGRVLLDTLPVTLPELEERLSQLKAETPEFPVIVKGDSQTQYQAVMNVLDVLGRLNITQVGLATKPR